MFCIIIDLRSFLFCTLCVFFTRNIVKNYWQVLLYHFNVKFLHIFKNKIFNFQKKKKKEKKTKPQNKPKDQRSPAKQLASNPSLFNTSPFFGTLVFFFFGINSTIATEFYSLKFIMSGFDREEEDQNMVFAVKPLLILPENERQKKKKKARTKEGIKRNRSLSQE